jgi:DNA repair photolyase
VCDPYQQVEAKYRLTRGAIELISNYRKFSISILTKNSLVLRDLDLLTRIKDRVDIGFTITSFNPKAQRYFEPHASPVSDRIETLRRFSESGFNTWAFIAPMLPYVTEENLEDGLNELAEAGVRRLMTDRYNSRGMIINQTLKAYESWDPAINLQEVRKLLWKGDEYYDMLDNKISHLWRTKAPNVDHERDFDWQNSRKSFS